MPRLRSATATAGSPRASAGGSEVAMLEDIAPQDTLEAEELALTETIRVAVPERSLRHDLRAASMVWRRELIRFRSDRLRAVTSLVQPILFLFVLGTGLSRLASHGLPTGVHFSTFIYSGVL